MHNWLRWNAFHNSKSVFMWLSICGFGMIIDTHPLLSEALGSCHPKLDLSWTWFRTDENTLKLSTLRHTSGSRIKSGMTNTESLTWKRMCPSFIVHYALFIIHYALRNEVRRKPIMHYALWNEVRRKPIMNYALWIMHYIMFARAYVCVRGAEPFELILRWKAALYGKKPALYGGKAAV